VSNGRDVAIAGASQRAVGAILLIEPGVARASRGSLSTEGQVERETGFEPATFCLGSPELVSVVA